jgi:hypothetical protein
MNEMQKVKYVSITPPAAIVDNASYTTASIDTAGWDYLTVVAYLGATDIAMTALKLQTSDTDGSYADLTGAVYGTSTDIAGSTSALPSSTDDNGFFVFEVDLRGKKRYFDLVATAGDGAAGTYLTAFAILSRGEQPATTASGRGCKNILRV